MENGEVEMCRERDLEEKKKESIRERIVFVKKKTERFVKGDN